MSADNWAKCPKCKHSGERDAAKARTKADAAYGKVLAVEWQRLEEEARAAASSDSFTLREDYELGTDEAGEFEVSYHAGCDRCGFKFSFKHKEKVKVE